MMWFPDTVDEFMELYKMTDTKQVYSNGTEYVPIFRMKQWFKHEQAKRKTGEWIIEEGYDGDEIYQCPFCKAEFVLIDGTPEENEYEYCPKCGAHLRYAPKKEDEDTDETAS